MDSKKQSRILQQAAKELGYEIKLTHAQEMIAKIGGFANRHALFAQDSISENIKYFRTDHVVFKASSSKDKLSTLEMAQLAETQGYGFVSGTRYYELTKELYDWCLLSDRYITSDDYLVGKRPLYSSYGEERTIKGDYIGIFHYFIKLENGKLILFNTVNVYLDDSGWICDWAETKF